MPTSPTRVLALGIDAANPGLLRQWADDGSLPNLRGLMERGAHGDMEGVRGFFVGATWPSMVTGASPAGHGFHYLVQLEPGGYDFYRPADHGISLLDPFWSHLDREGQRVAILDVPLTRADPSLEGVQVVEWGGHDSVYGFQASSEALSRELESRFGLHPLGLTCDGERRSARDYQVFLDRLLEGVRTKTQLTRHVLAGGEWDLFMQVFTESHCVGHQCWHLHDPGHPAHDPALREAVGDPLLQVYRAIDTGIGEILEGADDAMVLVFSAHSMSHWYGAQFLLREILIRLGVTHPAQEPSPAEGGSGPRHLSPARWAWHHLPAGLRDRLRPVRRSLGRVRDRLGPSTPAPSRLPKLDVDLTTSPCFPAPNGLAVGGIRLNLQGREPQGILDPGEVDAFVERLTANLMEVRNRRTGRPLVRGVARTSELYAGQHLDRLPDLLVEWDDEAPVGSTRLAGGAGAEILADSPATGPLEGRNEYGRSGEHRPHGMFVAAGPGVAPGRVTRKVSLLDLAPTLTALLGVDLPDAQGRAIPEILGAGPATGPVG